jgi:hypothetical protein
MKVEEVPGYNLYACDPKTSDETISILLCNLATHTAGFPVNLRILFPGYIQKIRMPNTHRKIYTGI